MPPDTNAKRGRKPRAGDDEIIQQVREALKHVDSPAVIAQDIEPHLPIGLRSLQTRLPSIASRDNALRSRDLGRAWIYWIEDDSDAIEDVES